MGPWSDSAQMFCRENSMVRLAWKLNSPSNERVDQFQPLPNEEDAASQGAPARQSTSN